MKWQPIETAPRDGAQIIVLGADRQAAIAEYYRAPDGFCAWEVYHDADGNRSFLVDPLTHWMPLPELPEVEL